jgi:hypothetical protein
MEGAMWMEALLLTPYLVLASSGLLIAAVVAICWTQSFPPRPPLPAHLDRRHRRRSGQRLSGVERRDAAQGRSDWLRFARPLLRHHKSSAGSRAAF